MEPVKNVLVEKWKPMLELEGCPKLDHKASLLTAQLLENTWQDIGSAGQAATLQQLTESTPVNVTGANIANWDPILMPLIRRMAPKMISYNLVGVQPMKAPVSQVFAIRSRYTNQTGTEAFMDEANTEHSGSNSGLSPTGGAQTTTDATNNPFEGTWTHNTALTTAQGEALGASSASTDQFNEMSMSIEKITVTAKTRGLKAEYTIELAQDLKAVHNLDAESELMNILSTEIVSEINREIIRTIYKKSKLGAQKNVASPGTFNLDVDANGRWLIEKYKGLMMAIEREANTVAKETRRGRANWIVCSSDVASALSMVGKLETNPVKNDFDVDDTGQTYVGKLNGKYDVYIDPYWTVSDMEICVTGFKGSNAWDAGIFYCPYVPLQIVRGQDQYSLQPKLGYKTRYGVVTNPFASSSDNANVYFRKFAITNIM